MSPLELTRALHLLEGEVARARAEGRAVLTEVELYPVLEAAGIAVPAWRIVDGEAGAEAARTIPGSRIVVKVVSPCLPHRTEVGGVRVVAAETAAVEGALRDLASIAADAPGARFLLAEWVEHDTTPGGELLLGARWTEDFGAIVTVGLGGVASELMARATGLVRILPAHDPGAAWVGGPREPADPLLALATGALRGRPPRVPEARVAEGLDRLGALARAAFPSLLTELEMNPAAVRDGALVALDALARVSPEGVGSREAAPPPLAPERRWGIGHVLAPRTVAVVGVSSRRNPGRTVVRNLLAAGFPADGITIVKDGEAALDGCRCVPSVAALDPPVDLLVVAVSAAEAPALLAEAVRGARARSVVLIPGGLGEGEAGPGLEVFRRVLDEARAAGVVVNGGNCLGVRSVAGRCDTLFVPEAKLHFPRVPPHPVALVTQSGAFAIARATQHPWLNPRYLVTVGNQVDLTVGEYVEALADDPEVGVVAAYVEGFRPLDGARLVRAARHLAAQGRLLLLFRGGRTERGARAALSHTAAVAGDWAVTRALVEGAGGLVAESLADFDHLLMAATLLRGKPIGGRGLGALSNAGFECVAMADASGGLELAELAPATHTALAALLRGHRLEGIVAPNNPLDVTPILGDEAFAEAARLLLADHGVDVGVVGCVPLTPALQTLPAPNPLGEELGREGGVLDGLAALARGVEKPWVAVVDSGAPYDALAAGLLQTGIPTFRRADAAVETLSRWVGWRLRWCVKE